MRITAIKPQAQRVDFYNVFVDGAYALSLSADGILQSGIVAGQEIQEEELSVLKDLSQADKLYHLTLSYLARRMRSESEIRDYLHKKHSPALLIEQIVNRLRSNALLDDEAFTSAYVRDQRALRNQSRRKITFALQQKKIAPEIIARAFADSQDDEQAALAKLITKMRRQSRYADDLKLLQYLVRQGYRYGDAKAALDNDRSETKQ